METIIIDHIIMHMIDMEHKKIIYSNTLVELTETSLEYYHKKLEKVFTSPQKKLIKVASQGLHLMRCQVMSEDENKFIEKSKEITDDLYRYCILFEDMPNANLVFIECRKDGIPFQVVMKLNYKIAAVNKIETDQQGNTNIRIAQIQSIPAKGLGVEEAIIVDLETKEVSIIEKKFMVDGMKDTYISNHYLQGETELNDRQKISIMEKAVKKINKQYFNSNIDNIAMVKQKMVESIVENDPIKPIEVASLVFDKDYGAQEECIEIMNEAGVSEESEVDSRYFYADKVGRCKIVTDTEIEIILNAQDYVRGAGIKKVENEDGTISIILDNIHELVLK